MPSRGMDKSSLPRPEQALPGRTEAMPLENRHFVHGRPLKPPFPAGMEQALFGMGCFWGAEKRFWTCNGVYTTAVGYAGGYTPNPTYREVCSGLTGHNEVVFVIYDPREIAYTELLHIFWESHDPTRGCARATTSAPSIVPASMSMMARSASPPNPRVNATGWRCSRPASAQ